MKKRMEYNKDKFAEDMAESMRKRAIPTQEAASNAIGVSQNTIFAWLSARTFPTPRRWERVRKVLGIDPADYMLGIANMPTTSSTITASTGASVIATISTLQGSPDEATVTLTPAELEILKLFRRYGNQALLAKCKRQLDLVAQASD